MPKTPSRGYAYPTTSSPATVPADLQVPLEQIDADMQTLVDKVGRTLQINPDGTLPTAAEQRVKELIASTSPDLTGYATDASVDQKLAAFGQDSPSVQVGGARPASGWWVDTGAGIVVAASVPVLDDATDTLTWVEREGVEYRIDGALVTSPWRGPEHDATVTVTASAAPGYELSGGPQSWTFEFHSSVESGVYGPMVLADGAILYAPMDDESFPLRWEGPAASFNAGGIVPGSAGGVLRSRGIGAEDYSVAIPGGTGSGLTTSATQLFRASGVAINAGATPWAVELIFSPELSPIAEDSVVIGMGGYLFRWDTSQGLHPYGINSTPGAGYISLPAGERAIIAWVADGTHQIAYLNGIEVGRKVAGAGGGLSPYLGGAGRPLFNHPAGLKGNFAGFAVWSQSIPTPAQILAHARAAGLA
ncbi:hypothetical protein PQI65_14960 [Brachybacterium paraconglomeratum]